MRKLTALVLTLCLLSSMILPAAADVIYEPEDDYYRKHMEEFVYDSTVWYANGEDGSVTVFDAPGGKPIADLPNGNVVYGTYRVEANGKTWIFTEHYDPETVEFSCWYIPMESLLNRYDQEFLEDYDFALEPLPEDYPAVQLPEEILIWTYPCGQYRTHVVFNQDSVNQFVRTLYRDYEGRDWGYVGYWYGHVDGWICLTDPVNPDLQDYERFTGPCYFDPESPVKPARPISQAALNPLYVAIPLCAAALATAALLLWPRMKKKEEE